MIRGEPPDHGSLLEAAHAGEDTGCLALDDDVVVTDEFDETHFGKERDTREEKASQVAWVVAA